MTVTDSVETKLEGVVVGHDGSEASTRATMWAARLAARLGLRLHVVRAWSLASAPRPDSAKLGYVPPITDFEQAVREQLKEDVVAMALPETLEVTCHAVHAAPSRALLESAQHAELLVVGSRGTGGFRGLLLGSTADQVVRHATCPVAVVPVRAAHRAAEQTGQPLGHTD